MAKPPPSNADQVKSEFHDAYTIIYPVVAFTVGIFLLLYALRIAQSDARLPLVRVVVYAGIASLFTAIGSTAVVRFRLGLSGLAGSAGGATAIAILLAQVIGVDPPAKVTTTYYLNFIDDLGNIDQHVDPKNLIASVDITKQGQQKSDKTMELKLTRSPGGSLAITIPDIDTDSMLSFMIQAKKGKKRWSSPGVPPTQGFMNVSLIQPDGDAE